MRVGLIADVHGDPVALELAWAHLTVMGAERIVLAGDVVGYGPLPDRVVAFLQEHAIAACRGNHDRWALERGAGVPDEFRGGTPSRDTLAYLATLPTDLTLGGAGRAGVVVHSEPGDDLRFITRATHPPRVLDGYLDALGADFLVTGHTHQPMWHRGPHGLVVNPGSVVSAPVVKTSRTFALLDLKALEVTFHDVETGGEVEVPPWGSRGAG